jgi:transposase-like protein
MVQTHAIMPETRIRCVRHMLADNGAYGRVTALSRSVGVSRQTLYTWADQGLRALERAFTPPGACPVVPPTLERDMLTLLVEGHASYRGLRRCLRQVGQRDVSLGTISAVVGEAQRRALALQARQGPPTARALALDELYGSDRHGAYLSVVDVASGAVWAAAGSLPVDADTWTLVLWELRERGVRWDRTVSDGGAAVQQACVRVDPDGRHQRDVWHVLHVCSQVQGRLDRRQGQADVAGRSATVARQAARVAAGHRPRGPRAVTDEGAHAAALAQAAQAADNLRYLSHELHALLDVVVLGRAGVLDSATRQEELKTVLALLAEVRMTAPPASQQDLARLHTALTRALPGLLTFTVAWGGVQQAGRARLGTDGLALVAWAWQRRALLGPTSADLLALLPAAWCPTPTLLLAAWDDAVRASSAVETWHSVLRPYLAVHRTLSSGMLALLAVWHNHQVSTRGQHAGQSPLQRSGLADAPSDWLVALGYPPADAAMPPAAQPLVAYAA